MNRRTAVSILSICAFALLAPPPVFADYFGLEVVDRSDLTICEDQTEPEIPYKLDVCDIHVVFDDAADRLISTAFSNVSTTAQQGFFQHTLGGNTAPACAQIALEPTLECDSFITLGLECDRGGSTTDPDFDSTGFNTSGEVSGGWYNSAPSNGQGDPDANDRVMIARFSYKQNKNTSGDVCVFTQLAGSQDVIAFLIEPFDCSVPGMQAGTGGGPPLGGPTICFVDDDGDPADDCLNGWDTACPDLQTALDPAKECTEIRVAQGTYFPDSGTGNRTHTFLLLNGVVIQGGYRGCTGIGCTNADDRDIDEFETILSGDLAGNDTLETCEGDINCIGFGVKCINGSCIVPDNIGDNSYHVVTGTSTEETAVLDGFTITAGHADSQEGPGFCFDDPDQTFCGEGNPCQVGECKRIDAMGAGMMVLFGGAAQVSNCKFTRNIAKSAGGGMYNGLSSPTVTDCTFDSNHVTNGGAGGMCNNFGSDAIVTNCTFIGNSARNGGGMGNNNDSTPTITDCKFRGNCTTGASPNGIGGGMYISNSSPIVSRCIFIGNFAQYGAGLSNTTDPTEEAHPVVTNCIFAGNDTLVNGGGIFNNFDDSPAISSAKITNCLFVGNSADGVSANGGGIGNYNPTQHVTITNCTFSGNSADSEGGGVYFANNGLNSKLDNCVFWGNDDLGVDEESAQIHVEVIPSLVTVTYSDIMGLTQGGPFCELCGEEPQVCCNEGVANGNIDDDPVFLENPLMDSGSWTAIATYDPVEDLTTFTHGGAAWTVNEHEDKFLNPDTTQFLQSLIESNTADEILVWGDFSELGDGGNENYKLFDYHLNSASGSPCIDAADNNAVTLCNADLDWNERFFDDLATEDTGNGVAPPFVDMGAYEFGGDPELDCDGNGFADSCCPADFDGDGVVGAFDLAVLLGAWGDCPDPCTVGDSTCQCRADLDDTCDVKASDLALLLGNWGPCCGDGQCLLGEDCTTCEDDCGSCP